MTLPARTFAPLDPDAYKHGQLLCKAKWCAHPVLRDGRTAYISYIGLGDSGGKVEMLVYLKGDPKPYAPSEITLAEQPS